MSDLLHSDPKTVLAIRDLSIGARGADAAHGIVKNVDMTIVEGEAVGVVGESGSGKSLTALAVGGMLPTALAVLSGSVALTGTEITRLRESQIHKIRGNQVAYVFQDPLNALNPTRTVGKHLGDVLRRRGRGDSGANSERAAVDALRAVGITEPERRLHAYPHQLSGGIRQRVLIAMALACRPRLLIADEPTTALDVTVQAKIVDLFRDIRRQRIAIMFISHNLDLVLEFCDTIVVMYGGRMMEKGSARTIASGARHPYTRALMDCVPRLVDPPGEFRVIAGQPPTALDSIAGCPFAPRCERALAHCASVPPPTIGVTATHAIACWNPVQAGTS